MVKPTLQSTRGLSHGLGTGKRFVRHKPGADYIKICYLEKLFRRAGVKRTRSCYKKACVAFSDQLLDRLIEKAITYMEAGRRKTLMVKDVKEAARFLNSSIYS